MEPTRRNFWTESRSDRSVWIYTYDITDSEAMADILSDGNGRYARG